MIQIREGEMYCMSNDEKIVDQSDINELSGITREDIRRFLNRAYKESDYCAKIENLSSDEIAKVQSQMHVNDCSFLFAFEDIYKKLGFSIELIVLNDQWKPSMRQKYLLENNISNYLEELIKYDYYSHKDLEIVDGYNAKRCRNIENYVNIFWEIYDYFDNYGDKTSIICFEEFMKVAPYIFILLTVCSNNLII